MKRAVSSLTAWLLIAVLAVTAAVPALAADQKDISAALGHEINVALSGDASVEEYDLADGTLAPGTELALESGRLLLQGTPRSAGDYTATIVTRSEGGRGQIRLRARIRVLDEPAPAGSGSAGLPPHRYEPETAAPAPTPDPTPAPTAEAAPAATATPAPTGPKITKHPGGEMVSVGGTAMFVARAEDAATITWRVVNASGSETYDATQVGGLFNGLAAYGQGTETLALYNIPLAFSGWQVECVFDAANGSRSVSDRAVITVQEPGTGTPASPTILSAPESTAVQIGNPVTLSVNAVPYEGCSLKYQWFQTTEDDPATMLMIADATTSSYTPPQTEGTVYYSVEIRSVNANGTSLHCYTPLAAVTYSVDPPVIQHDHEFSTAWYYDASSHWHECACGERADKETHSFTWTETVRATARRTGERVGVCSVCGYERRETIPAKSSGRPSRVLLWVLLILVIAMLVLGAGWYVRKSGGAFPKKRGNPYRRR